MKDIFCLTDFTDCSSLILEPLRHTNRIKYTSFDASQNFYIFGATTGSLYLFSRKECKFLHLIPNKNGSVTHVAISPNEKFVAFSTAKSVISVYVINTSANSAPQVVAPSNGLGSINTNNIGEINCIRWSLDEKQFYYGDKKGQVNMVALNSFMGRSILTVSVHPVLFLDSPILQIDDYESLLLVSNYNKCILCNTEYEEYKQIGNRPRDGDYGTCFLISQNENETPSRIYCARPGSRIWEVDLEGNVIQTHQFKTELACPPKRIQRTTSANELSLKYDNENEEIIDFQPQNLQFAKLQTIFSEFLVTFTEIALYVFDVRNSEVVLWCNQFERIADCRIVGDEMVIFSQSGGLHTVRLQTLQSYAIELIRRENLLDCSLLLKRNLKYFSDKAKEDFELTVLNQIKNYLIDKNQYEMLNDLSVIFDSISQNEGELSIGSSEERRSAGKASSENSDRKSIESSQSGVYVLENSFCDNLRNCKSAEKESLLTVTGKFGKNIIKYKFNIFSDEQKTLVKDLLPKSASVERTIPFKDINYQYENDEEIVCKKITRKNFPQEKKISDEEKTIYNLFLIFRSSQISNTNFLDRYRELFDEYTSTEIISILAKLETVMVENGDSEIQAKKNCYAMYFNYLKPEIIWEIDEVSRKFIIDGFILLNSRDDAVKCESCEHPIRYENSCQYHELGETLFKYLWSRNDNQKCLEILKSVPSLYDVLSRFYVAENSIDKILPIVMNFGEPCLLEEMGKHFTEPAWEQCFDIFAKSQNGELLCSNCGKIHFVENLLNRHFFYSWNCFLNISLQFVKPDKILELILKYAKEIPNDAIDREFYMKVLLKANK